MTAPSPTPSRHVGRGGHRGRGARAVAFLRLGRPLHLVGGLAFHALGLAAAHHVGHAIDWTTAAWGQVAITSIQLCTHFGNDYFDLDADRASSRVNRWSGGSRVLPEGLLPPRAALVAAVGFGMIALATTVYISVSRAEPVLTLSLLVSSLALAWSYSGPPLFLNRRGLGEITGALLIPGFTTLVGFELQAGRLERLPILAAIPLCCLQFAMLVAVNFPDAAGDASVSKRTLVVRLGGARAARLLVTAMVVGYGCLPLLMTLGLPAAAALGVLASGPLGIGQAWQVMRGAWAREAEWDRLGFWAIGVLMAAAAGEALALAWTTG